MKNTTTRSKASKYKKTNIADISNQPSDPDNSSETYENASIFEPEKSKFVERDPGSFITNYQGIIEEVSENRISGWITNLNEPEDPVSIDIFDGDRKLITIVADAYRPDVRDAGIGNGYCGFSVSNVSVLFPQSRHIVSVKRSVDGVDLIGSPADLIQSGIGLDAAAFEYIRNATNMAIRNAKSVQDLDENISLSLQILNDLIDARHSLETGIFTESDSFRIQDFLNEADLSDWTKEIIKKTLQDFPNLELEWTADPLVSVIIPVYNNFKLTYQCIKSIKEAMPLCDFEVLIVDDCSSDETLFGSFVFSGGIKVIRNNVNSGFVRSCNFGSRNARGKFLLFLNNDTIVEKGWMDELVNTFYDSENVGVAGSKLLFEDGTLQECGGIIWRFGDGWNWGRNQNPALPQFCYMRDSDYVSGAALMIQTKLFQELNGFDELFAPAYYEDTDLCFRVRKAGFRTVVQPASKIVHLEGKSAGTDVAGTGMKRFQKINNRKFYERWQKTLSSHRFNGESPELEAERNVKLRAFFIDDSVPTPDKDAGSNAAISHMRALMQLGYKVTFIPADNMAAISPYTDNLQKIGIECLHAPYYWSVEEVFRKSIVKPDIVYLHRFSNASKYSSMIRRHFERCKIIYNVADLHSLRQTRETEVEGQLSGVHVSELSELGAMRMCDSIIVHSNVEELYLRDKDESLRVFTVPWQVNIRKCNAQFGERNGFAFVGGYGHRPNVDAAVYLVGKILPAVRKMGVFVKCYLIGSNVPKTVLELGSEEVCVLGYVPDLTPLLHQLRFTVAPLRYGAGVKGKVLESLAHGIPCIMSVTASEGIKLPKSLSWLIAKSEREFAVKITELDSNQLLNEELAAAGYEFIRNNYNEKAVEEMLALAIR